MNPDNIAEILNDLVQINNDRIANYENAISQLEAGYDNLTELFGKMIEESKGYNAELTKEIDKLHEDVAKGTSGAGKIHRTWMDFKAILTGGDARPILNTCETLESAVQRAYEEALEEEGLTAELHLLLTKQKAGLLNSHSHIKQLLEIATS